MPHACCFACHLYASLRGQMAVHCHQTMLYTGARQLDAGLNDAHPTSHAPQIALRPGDTPMSPSKVSPADFQVLKVVGQGAFGKVGSGK